MPHNHVQPNIDLLKKLPQVEEVLKRPQLVDLAARFPREKLAQSVREAVDAVRQRILAGEEPDESIDAIAARAAQQALALERPSLRRVINATGVIVHTNLGRSPLAPEAVAAVNDVIGGYSTLEYNTDRLERGSRHAHCENLIRALTGAEAAIAVNNNAAAVMMVLSEFAHGAAAIVSRGELVEIGGSFRIPDIMELSGARMVEVGTTNKTHLVDYARAIDPAVSMLLKVHPSNYRMLGFTESVPIGDLRDLADRENASRRAAADGHTDVLVYEDQGSGAFARLDAFGTYAEPTVAESLKAGADLVSFSGDKLLGGPQAGIIVGRKVLIDRLKKNPLARALRLDKMTLAALEATLRLYLHPERAQRDVPTLRMLTETAADVDVRARKLLEAVQVAVPEGAAELSVVDEISRAGGGALPMCDIPTRALRVSFARGNAQQCHEFMVRERAIPVVGRVKDGQVLLDARTLLDDEEIAEVARALGAYFGSLEG
ncbi:MAG: L-seryl-tRNA(Sec) selenium transferase [Eggerthellaceae bacterium]|nr:L-seryl-tRNA(Sec) selenium transferase [Eggerthellaceae bacterium]